MADDKTKRGSPDSKRLNKSEPYEMAYARKKAKAAGGATAKRAARASGAAPAARKRVAAKAPVRGTPRPPKEDKTIENTAPRTMKAADAIDLLTDDHLQVSALFKQYEKLARSKASGAERRTLAGTLCTMLKTHTAIEEEIFYPAARRAKIEASLLDEADIEHASAKALIAQIEYGTPSERCYDARVRVLGEYVAHHVVEEHTEMFTKCRRAGMDLVALRERMAARKAELERGGPAAGEEGIATVMSSGTESPGLLTRVTESLFSGKNP